MYPLANVILDGVDPDVELRVRSCVDRFRERVRDGVKDAFMFTLGARKGIRHSVTLSIERGDAMLSNIVHPTDALGTALSAYRDSIADGLACIRRLQSATLSLPDELSEELDGIYPANESRVMAQFLEMLDTRIQRAGVVDYLLTLRSDFLGAYVPSARSGHIVLHWGLIGLLASKLDVPVEAMALKVLAHEYAHAMSHLGVDADGEHWNLAEFLQADRDVHEGLANYFSAAALKATDDWWFQQALVALARIFHEVRRHVGPRCREW